MKRKHAVIAGGLLAGGAALAGLFAWLLTHEPGFYRAALQNDVAPAERRKQSKRFVQSTSRLVNDIRNSDEWSQEFSEADVNSWLADELPAKYGEWLPPEVTAPRVKFEEGAMRFAFQTRRGAWSGVVSGRVRAWVAGANEIAFEIQSISAGLVPVPIDDVIGQLVTAMTARGWRMEWQQSEGGDVLIVSLDDSFAGESYGRPALETVELLAGRLRVAGGRQPAPADPRTAERPEAAPQAVGGDDDAVK